MVDLAESPAVAPMDTGGDERAGMFAAGAILVALGLGLGVLVNVVAHWMAAPSGTPWGPVRVFPSFGPYAWAALGLGLFTGAIGIGVLLMARASAKGRLVLPGQAY